jgi:hypothetical protein
MTMAGTQTMARGRFLTGLLLGLVIGAVAAAGGTVWYINHASSKGWIDAGAMWILLPGHAPAGPMPQTFAIPAKAWDYGAETAALEPNVTEQPGVLRVQLGEVRGNVGVSLARPDGSALVSKERPVTAADSGKPVYFRVTGREGLIAVLVRNYNAEGQVGSVAVNTVAYIPEAGLSRDQLSEINKGGVN